MAMQLYESLPGVPPPRPPPPFYKKRPRHDGEVVQTRVRQVVGDLVSVLGQLKSVVGDIRTLVTQIDVVTHKIDQSVTKRHSDKPPPRRASESVVNGSKLGGIPEQRQRHSVSHNYDMRYLTGRSPTQEVDMLRKLSSDKRSRTPDFLPSFKMTNMFSDLDLDLGRTSDTADHKPAAAESSINTTSEPANKICNKVSVGGSCYGDCLTVEDVPPVGCLKVDDAVSQSESSSHEDSRSSGSVRTVLSRQKADSGEQSREYSNSNRNNVRFTENGQDRTAGDITNGNITAEDRTAGDGPAGDRPAGRRLISRDLDQVLSEQDAQRLEGTAVTAPRPANIHVQRVPLRCEDSRNGSSLAYELRKYRWRHSRDVKQEALILDSSLSEECPDNDDNNNNMAVAPSDTSPRHFAYVSPFSFSSTASDPDLQTLMAPPVCGSGDYCDVYERELEARLELDYLDDSLEMLDTLADVQVEDDDDDGSDALGGGPEADYCEVDWPRRRAEVAAWTRAAWVAGQRRQISREASTSFDRSVSCCSDGWTDDDTDDISLSDADFPKHPAGKKLPKIVSAGLVSYGWRTVIEP